MRLFDWISNSLFGSADTSASAPAPNGMHDISDHSGDAGCSVNPATGLPMINDDSARRTG